MTKSEDEIKKLFRTRLQQGEDLLWLGSNGVSEKFIPLIFRYFALLCVVSLPISISIWGVMARYPWLTVVLLLVPALVVEANKGISRWQDELSSRQSYAITNERVLIAKRGKVHQYSLIHLRDAVLSKPDVEGRVTLSAYYLIAPGGEMPAPIFQLEGLDEADAQSAYELIQEGHEEALEEKVKAKRSE